MAPADATGSPSTSDEGTLHSPSASPSLGRANIADMCDSREDLLGRIHNLKKDLQEWRGKLDTQVKTHREELGDLKNTLNLEVEQLKSEFEDLRKSLRKQLDDATNMGSMIHGSDKKLEESVPNLMKETNINKVDLDLEQIFSLRERICLLPCITHFVQAIISSKMFRM